MPLQLSGRIKRLLPLVFALVMGLVAVGLVRHYLAQQRVTLERERARLLGDYQAPVQVVVAAKDLPEGTLLDPALLTTAAVPEKFVQPYASRSAGEVAGLLTVAAIAEGEQVLLNKVRRPEAVPKDAGLSSITPRGKRAVTIGVDAITGVGGFVRPGDAVDILWTIQLPGADRQQGDVVTLTLFQEVPVLAVGTETVRQRGQQVTKESPYTVTLALTPQETSFLLYAREQGRIQLSLRAQGEQGLAAVAPANINTLMETMMGVPAGASARGPKQVEVYKGLKRDVVLLPEE